MRTDGPNPGIGLALLRVVTGVIFVAHGAPKLFGGGVGGLGEMLAGMGVPLSTAVAWGVSLLEFFGGVALIAGLLVVPAAGLLAIHMLMGIILVHAPNGFYVVGPGTGGVEFSLLLVAALTTLLLAGPGVMAADTGLGGGSGPEAAPPGSGGA